MNGTMSELIIMFLCYVPLLLIAIKLILEHYEGGE